MRVNLVVHDSLEGGINASTQLDPAAKGMAQMLLRFPVRVPARSPPQLAAPPRSAESRDLADGVHEWPRNDYSYLMKGLTRVPTDSSVLVSSSKYLNDPRIRDWLATHLLRKNGPDAPTPSDPMPLVLALREVQDIEHINELFAAERRKNAALDAWFRDGQHVHLQARGLAGLCAGTLRRHLLQAADGQRPAGGHRAPVQAAERLPVLLPARRPDARSRAHSRAAAASTSSARWCRTTCASQSLRAPESPKLAGELCVFYMLSSTRILTRAVLHYPQTWLTVLDALERGAAGGARIRAALQPALGGRIRAHPRAGARQVRHPRRAPGRHLGSFRAVVLEQMSAQRQWSLPVPSASWARPWRAGFIAEGARSD